MATNAILQVKSNGSVFYVMAHEDDLWKRTNPIDAKSQTPFDNSELRFVLHKMKDGELTDEFIGYISDINPGVYFPRIHMGNSATYRCHNALCIMDIVYKFPQQCVNCRG